MFSGCNSTKEVTGEAFTWKYKNRNMETMHSSKYIGEFNEHFFIKVRSMSLLDKSKWNESYIHTHKNNLSDELRDQLESLNLKFDPKNEAK